MEKCKQCDSQKKKETKTDLLNTARNNRASATRTTQRTCTPEGWAVHVPLIANVKRQEHKLNGNGIGYQNTK